MELAIALVIIGLIVGGVVAGSEVVERARLRSIIAEGNEFNTMIAQFYIKYKALPGDMDNASDYWPALGYTVDGSGDGVMICDLTTVHEQRYFFDHLTLSGYADYVLQATSSQTFPEAGHSGRWTPIHIGADEECQWRIGGDGDIYDADMDGNYIAIGAPTDPSSLPTLGNGWSLGIIMGLDAFGIDKKIDDGVPNTGTFRAQPGHNGTAYESGCVSVTGTINSATAVAYDLTNEERSCHPLFRFGVGQK